MKYKIKVKGNVYTFYIKTCIRCRDPQSIVISTHGRICMDCSDCHAVEKIPGHTNASIRKGLKDGSIERISTIRKKKRVKGFEVEI